MLFTTRSQNHTSQKNVSAPCPLTLSGSSPFFRLPPELRIIIYSLVLSGTEKPRFFIEGTDVWRCGAPADFMRPGPPRVLLVCRQMAEEASAVLHEVRELRFMAIPKGLATSGISCYHRFCTLEAFAPTLRRIQRLSLSVNTHAAPNDEIAGMAVLNHLCTVLENRPTPLRNLRLSLDCCWRTGEDRCRDDLFFLAERFRLLGPVSVEHLPWNGQCIWANVCNPRFEAFEIMYRDPPSEQEAFEKYLYVLKEGIYPINIGPPVSERASWKWKRTVRALLAFRGFGRFAALATRRQS